jgi:hypothetical protein
VGGRGRQEELMMNRQKSRADHSAKNVFRNQQIRKQLQRQQRQQTYQQIEEDDDDDVMCQRDISTYK